MPEAHVLSLVTWTDCCRGSSQDLCAFAGLCCVSLPTTRICSSVQLSPQLWLLLQGLGVRARQQHQPSPKEVQAIAAVTGAFELCAGHEDLPGHASSARQMEQR